MIKQEQSEKIVYGSLITSTKCYNCIHFPLCFAQKGGANLELASENDCCYYQSKLSEDSVVLSREEYDEIKTFQSYIPEMKKAFDKIRNATIKETAEKILDLLVPDCKACDENWHSGCLCLRATLAEKIAKQFGLEVEE